MISRFRMLALIAAGPLAALATAQPTGTYASGLLHQPLGNVQDMTVDGRRLTACCIGSTGEDGVDIQLNSAWGGGVQVEVPSIFNAGESSRIRWRGWDGTIKGRIDLTGNGDGTATLRTDFSEIGAIDVQYTAYDREGTEVGSGSFPDGGIFIEDFACPPGTVFQWWYVATWNPPQGTQPGYWVYTVGFICAGALVDDNPNTSLLRIVPTLPGGALPHLGMEALMVTGTGSPQLIVEEADLQTFGVSSYGLGQAQLQEECGGPAPCDPSERDLIAENIGSSGQDGVAIDFGAETGEASLRSKRCPDCPPGHVTLIKFYDEQGRVMMTAPHRDGSAGGFEEMSPDFSSIGASEYLLELLDDNGNPISSSIQLSATAIRWFHGCPDGSYPHWIWVPWGGGHWIFQGCIHYMDFVLPTGEVVPNVSEARLTPLDSSSVGQPRRCEVSTDATRTIIDDVRVTRRCPGDVTGDNSVELGDLAILLSNFGSTPAGLGDGDLNGDDSVDLSDLAVLLSKFGSGCP